MNNYGTALGGDDEDRPREHPSLRGAEEEVRPLLTANAVVFQRTASSATASFDPRTEPFMYENMSQLLDDYKTCRHNEMEVHNLSLQLVQLALASGKIFMEETKEGGVVSRVEVTDPEQAAGVVANSFEVLLLPKPEPEPEGDSARDVNSGVNGEKEPRGKGDSAGAESSTQRSDSSGHSAGSSVDGVVSRPILEQNSRKRSSIDMSSNGRPSLKRPRPGGSGITTDPKQSSVEDDDNVSDTNEYKEQKASLYERRDASPSGSRSEEPASTTVKGQSPNVSATLLSTSRHGEKEESTPGNVDVAERVPTAAAKAKSKEQSQWEQPANSVPRREGGHSSFWEQKKSPSPTPTNNENETSTGTEAYVEGNDMASRNSESAGDRKHFERTERDWNAKDEGGRSRTNKIEQKLADADKLHGRGEPGVTLGQPRASRIKEQSSNKPPEPAEAAGENRQPEIILPSRRPNSSRNEDTKFRSTVVARVPTVDGKKEEPIAPRGQRGSFREKRRDAEAEPSSSDRYARESNLPELSMGSRRHGKQPSARHQNEEAAAATRPQVHRNARTHREEAGRASSMMPVYNEKYFAVLKQTIRDTEGSLNTILRLGDENSARSIQLELTRLYQVRHRAQLNTMQYTTRTRPRRTNRRRSQHQQRRRHAPPTKQHHSSHLTDRKMQAALTQHAGHQEQRDRDNDGVRIPSRQPNGHQLTQQGHHHSQRQVRASNGHPQHQRRQDEMAGQEIGRNAFNARQATAIAKQRPQHVAGVPQTMTGEQQDPARRVANDYEVEDDDSRGVMGTMHKPDDVYPSVNVVLSEYVVQKNDVICGAQFQNHPGNVVVESFLAESMHRYKRLTNDSARELFLDEVLKAIASTGGTFIRPSDVNDIWIQLSQSQARYQLAKKLGRLFERDKDA